MSISSVMIYEKLKPKLGEEETKALIEYVDVVTKSGVATKEDLMSLHGELKDDINALRDELKGDINALRDELKGDINALRDELKGDINGLRGEMNGFREEIAVMKSNMATRDDIWKLRLLVVIVLIVVILFNPKVLDLLGKVLGVGM